MDATWHVGLALALQSRDVALNVAFPSFHREAGSELVLNRIELKSRWDESRPKAVLQMARCSYVQGLKLGWSW